MPRRQMAEKCFACGKPLSRTKKMADTRDDQIVWVGPDCYRKINAAGENGWRGPLGGPALYPTRQVSTAEVEAYIRRLIAADIADGIE